MSDTILASTRKGLFCFDRSSEGAWRQSAAHFLGDNVTLSMVDARDGAWYAALDHGHFGVKLHRSDDRGASWTELNVPEYPEKPADEAPTADGRDLKWALKLIWALAPGGDDAPGELWAGTIPGGLFRSVDRGEHWELIRGLWDHPDRKQWFGGGADQPGIHSVLVDPRDPRHVLVGVSCGGVWESLDRGATWTVRADGMRADFMPPERAGDPVIQDPHMVVACASNFDHLWAQHHCGIFKSVDGAKSWQEIKEAGPSTFGFAVAVDPNDSQRAWFVPAVSDQHRIPVDGELVVTRTSDGGESFDVLRAGLPREPSYDLVFRHALAIDASGEALSFGSTTGSLWFSDNAGEQWLQLSTHLPPIYAVTFADS